MIELHEGSAAPVTVLGLLRREMSHCQEHQMRVAEEWDHTLEILRGIDFSALGPGKELLAIRAEVEIWNDLTLDPVRRVTQLEGLGGLPEDEGERYGYLHRVFVGIDPDTYLTMCDEMEERVGDIGSSERTEEAPDLRDRMVELMELGVRASARSIEWLEKRYKDVELDG
jgi:hypothetical protein